MIFIPSNISRPYSWKHFLLSELRIPLLKVWWQTYWALIGCLCIHLIFVLNKMLGIDIQVGSFSQHTEMKLPLSSNLHYYWWLVGFHLHSYSFEGLFPSGFYNFISVVLQFPIWQGRIPARGVSGFLNHLIPFFNSGKFSAIAASSLFYPIIAFSLGTNQIHSVHFSLCALCHQSSFIFSASLPLLSAICIASSLLFSTILILSTSVPNVFL